MVSGQVLAQRSRARSLHTYTAYLTRIGTTNNVSIEYWTDESRLLTQTGQNFVNQPLNLIIDPFR